MMKFLPQKSKKGVTLVESVMAVVVLGMLATGILTLLTTGGIKIQEISGESAAYAEATQKLDFAISSISNGAYITVDSGLVSLAEDDLENDLDLDGDGLQVTKVATYDGKTGSFDLTEDNVRGWYLTLTYHNVTVSGFASNSEGVFDN